jgi:hypothetical protein
MKIKITETITNIKVAEKRYGLISIAEIGRVPHSHIQVSDAIPTAAIPGIDLVYYTPGPTLYIWSGATWVEIPLAQGE